MVNPFRAGAILGANQFFPAPPEMLIYAISQRSCYFFRGRNLMTFFFTKRSLQLLFKTNYKNYQAGKYDAALRNRCAESNEKLTKN